MSQLLLKQRIVCNLSSPSIGTAFIFVCFAFVLPWPIFSHSMFPVSSGWPTNRQIGLAQRWINKETDVQILFWACLARYLCTSYSRLLLLFDPMKPRQSARTLTHVRRYSMNKCYGLLLHPYLRIRFARTCHLFLLLLFSRTTCSLFISILILDVGHQAERERERALRACTLTYLPIRCK